MIWQIFWSWDEGIKISAIKKFWRNIYWNTWRKETRISKRFCRCNSDWCEKYAEFSSYQEGKKPKPILLKNTLVHP